MNKVSLSIAKFTVIEVMHNRLFWLVFGAALVGMGIGVFGHSLAITESDQTQTIFMSASLRFFAVLIVTLVVINTVSRDLNDKNLEMILSLAITRSSYFFGKLFGFSVITSGIVVFFGLCLLFTTSASNVFLWMLSLYCELFLVLSFSLLCATTIRQVPISVIVVFGFYLLSRSISAAVLMVDSSSLIAINSVSTSIMSTVLYGIALMMPDLSYFTQGSWLIYGDVDWLVLSEVILQTIVYSILLSSASLMDFYRKSL